MTQAKKIFLLSCLLCSCSLGSNAQENYVTKKTATPKAKTAYDEAKKAYGAGDLKTAIKSIDKAIGENSTFLDAFFFKAVIYRSVNRLAEAETTMEQAIKISTTYEPDILFSLAEVEKNQQKLDEALEHYKQFLASNSTNNKAKIEAKEYVENVGFVITAKKNPVPFEPSLLKGEVNTPQNSEYLPSITADGQTMIYTEAARADEDLMMSTWSKNAWSAGKPLSNLNTNANEGVQSISADGRFFTFTACSRPDGLGVCDIYYSYLGKNSWQKPINIGAPINTTEWEGHPSITNNGNTIYFSSDRAGGLGGKDVWRSDKNQDGTWAMPINLGKNINTSKDEETPFVHEDNQTLYFMSNGLLGMGKSDLFFSRKDTTDNWQLAKNLGYPINTEEVEGGLRVSFDGKKAYFAKGNRNNTNQSNIDIYEFPLYEAARPQAVTYVKGTVKDANTLEYINAKAEIMELATGRIVSTVTTDWTGTFLICLPVGKNYSLNVNKEKYIFYSDYFSLHDSSSFEKPFLLNISLLPIKQTTLVVPSGEKIFSIPIVLKNIFFKSGSAQLLDVSLIELLRLKNMLDENSTIQIQINGHTDNVGEAAENLILSTNRAKAVHDFLLEKNIDKKRLSYKGFGENQAIMSNETSEGRQQNRRTEFQITRF